ncbi:MAG: IS1595 family transposase [Vicinamibacterales bacterium]|jgi:transposase-like protein|nr:DDE transposase [Acidobacteriota bacterium]MDP6372795.1 IS1595 family transposase [Vicinamibacterales bacterium]MDP6607453.1 IS1595 family transposase [Vicinamibacterales bacterium]HAK54567.1 IS1595 family transposase [Acidobacteriota bacterium]|tara:strand:- start:6297 stop:7304 length:1008 start_codon:yes stop_codon:yes gene_type:complete
MAKNTKKSKAPGPQTLLQAIRYFADRDVALTFMVTLRWPDGKPTCPRCEDQKVSFITSRRVWTCLSCRKQFSVKVGTIFEDSPIGLDRWLPALWMVANCKNGISSYELGRALGVTQKTAWFMVQRIRLAMQTKTFNRFRGHVEVDESFIGGRARNMHKGRRDRMLRGRQSGWFGKTAVMGLLNRHGEDGHSVVRTEVIGTTRRRELRQHMNRHIEMDGQTTIYTDALKSYTPKTPKGWRPADDSYVHKVIDHAEAYAIGNVHTNGMENFWSLLKRSIRGTYVSVEPFHLFRYLDEQVYKFNNRLGTDADRFVGLVRSIVGCRLTYADLTGSTTPA